MDGNVNTETKWLSKISPNKSIDMDDQPYLYVYFIYIQRIVIIFVSITMFGHGILNYILYLI